MSTPPNTGYAIAIAWPETLCKRAGAWYDVMMELVGLSKNGYYQVGHAAIVLVDGSSGECHYFDFGRYHAPAGYGRVRDARTDHDLRIITIGEIRDGNLVNKKEILKELQGNESCHGTGKIYGGSVKVNFELTYATAKSVQNREFIKYGPFILNGTNCSRFVNKILLNGGLSFMVYLKLKFPFTFTPTPMSIVNTIKKQEKYESKGYSYSSSTSEYSRI